MAWKGYHFKCLGSTNVRRTFFTAAKAFLLAQGWELHDSWAEAKAEYYIFSSTNPVLNNETITIDTKTYTFKTTLTPTEGEILIGANYISALDNLKLAINRTDPGANDGVKYKVAAAHPTFEATTNTDTRQDIRALSFGEDMNSVALAENISNWGGWTRSVWARENTVVFKSRGESGLEPYGYVSMNSDPGSNYLEVRVYQYWDAGTHTGTRANAQGSVVPYRLINFSTTYDCLIAGDKDMVYLFSQYAGDYNQARGVSWGHLPVRGIADLAVTSDAIVAGSSVSIPVDNSAKLPGINGYFQIVGAAGEGCDRLQITGKPDGTHVVVATLPRNYASGAICGQPASTFGIIAINVNYNPDYLWRPVSYPTDAGLTVSATTYGGFSAINMTAVSGFTGKIGMTPFFIAVNGVLVLGVIDKGVFYTSGFTTWDVIGMNNDGSITTANILATSATPSSIVDATKTWTTNEHVGRFVITVGGTGLNQIRKITANDGTTLTIEQDWLPTPDGTTTFRIYDKMFRLHGNFPLYAACATLVTETKIPT